MSKKRNWDAAILKCEDEGSCRVCSKNGEPTNGPLDPAHTIGRSRDRWAHELDAYWVDPESIVPLCRPHHTAFDEHRLDLLPYLDINEQLNAVDAAGGIFSAYKRLCPTEFAKERV